jgi:TolA-binding protein
MTVLLSMALGWSAIAAPAQQSAATAARAKNTRKKMVSKASGPAISAQLSEQKQAIDAQQQQIRQLSDQVQSRD